MSKNSKMLLALSVVLLPILFFANSMDAEASNSKECLDDLNSGIATIIDASAHNSDSAKEAMDKLVKLSEQNKKEQDVQENELFMANVNMAMNVRQEPTEESEKVGVLYKDCGGHVLERQDGWSKIQSGDLVGWANDEYLLFGEDAETLADDVGFQVVVVQTDALALRKDADENGDVIGLMAMGDELEFVEAIDDKWVSVEYEGDLGYVVAEYVTRDFQIDAGETVATIEKREAEEAARKAAEEAAAAKKKLTAKQSAVIANADETRLLGALIQCEAGTRSPEGMLAVGAVVMNRVRSGAYPNTISGVIYASGQFTPALNGKVAARYNSSVNDACLAAAQAAINGETNVGTATHFRRAGSHEGIEYGGQVFW